MKKILSHKKEKEKDITKHDEQNPRQSSLFSLWLVLIVAPPRRGRKNRQTLIMNRKASVLKQERERDRQKDREYT